MKAVDEETLSKLLADIPMGKLLYFNRLPSTNATALEWVAQRPPDYSLVVADHQIAGYGRNQRSWHAHAGASLSFSLILYPHPEEQQSLPLFSALAALAVCTALDAISPSSQAEIKWPNDVLLDGKKCAGILCEAVWQGTTLCGLVMGVGVNISSAALPPVSSLLFPATSLEDAFGKNMDRWEILHCILEQLLHVRNSFPSSTFLNDWRTRLAFLGQPVTITSTNGQTHSGIMQDVDEQGYLVLKEKTGQQLSFPMGEVSLRPASL